jgi:hypothetical protein
MTCPKCNGTGSMTMEGILDCGFCNVATERTEFNKRLKEAGSMSVEDAAWWGYMQAGKEKAE